MRRRKYGGVPETVIEEYLKEKIESIGGICIKGNAHNQRGMPDRVCILPNGVIVFVEVKRPGLKPRPNQRLMIKRFNKLGHTAVYVNTFRMIDTLIKWLQRIMIAHQVVSTEQVCNRMDCSDRVKESWKEYVTKYGGG